MDCEPLVSVVIPCYQGRAFVRDAVDSVLAQTYARHEVIVVDDGSATDPLQPSDLRASVRLLRHPERRGTGAARNTGIDAAKGELVAFLDADDVWLPGKLEAQVQALTDHPDVALTHCHAIVVDQALEPLPEQPEPVLDSSNVLRRLLRRNYVWSPSSVLIRREVLEACGGFDPSIIAAEDWDLWINVARHHAFLADPRPLFLYRRHPGQVTAQRTGYLKSHERLRSKWLAWAIAEAPEEVTVMRKALCRDLQRHAWVHAWERGDLPTARRCLLRAIRAYPPDLRSYSRLARTYLTPLHPTLRNNRDLSY